MAHTFVKARELDGYRVQAVDGEVGWVRDLLIDDIAWRVGYLVVETGSWYDGGPVILAPRSITGVDPGGRHIEVVLSRDQVRESPSLDAAVGSSRKFDEDSDQRVYGWAEAFDAHLGSDDVPMPPAPPAVQVVPGDEEPSDADHLHSAQAAMGARVAGRDGEIGRLSDLLLDDTDWSVRYVEIACGEVAPSGDTSGRRVLMEPSWLGETTWADDQPIRVDVSRWMVDAAPPYTGSGEVDADHQGRMARYWAGLV